MSLMLAKVNADNIGLVSGSSKAAAVRLAFVALHTCKKTKRQAKTGFVEYCSQRAKREVS